MRLESFIHDKETTDRLGFITNQFKAEVDFVIEGQDDNRDKFKITKSPEEFKGAKDIDNLYHWITHRFQNESILVIHKDGSFERHNLSLDKEMKVKP